MAKKTLTRKDHEKLIDEYIYQREQLLQKKVGKLAISLFDRVFNEYLQRLEQSNGKIVNNAKNINVVNGIDQVYNRFNLQENVPVVKSFLQDASGLTEKNEAYFETVADRPVTGVTKQAKKVTYENLGVNHNGSLVKGGFAEKFIKDQTLLKDIKRTTVKAIVQQKGFIQLKNELKQKIQGVPDKPLSGGLQQYYRNFAYDTLMNVDRINAQTFADGLGLRFFYWSGGIIKTSRNICIKANGHIFDSLELKKLKYEDLQPMYRDGLSPDWIPLKHLGYHACRHRKNYVSDQEALKHKEKWFDLNTITKGSVVVSVAKPTIKEVMAKAKEAGPELDKMANDIAKENNGFTTPLSLKSEESIIRKSTNDYAGDVTQVKDAVRTTIISPNVEGVLKNIEASGIAVKIKRQEHDKDPLGYSGSIVNVRMSNGTLGEIQVNTARMIYAKQGEDSSLRILGEETFNKIKIESGLPGGLGHKYYEEWRLLNPLKPEEAIKMKEIEATSKKYYSYFI